MPPAAQEPLLEEAVAAGLLTMPKPLSKVTFVVTQFWMLTVPQEAGDPSWGCASTARLMMLPLLSA